MAEHKKWKKVLYENHGYPDNYTDNNIFLAGLKKNIHFKEVSYTEAVVGASFLVQELCSVVAFILVYVYIYNELVPPYLILTYLSAITLVGYVFHVLSSEFVYESLGHNIRTLLIYFFIGYLFSPVMYKLTDTISTDTIYTASFFMMLIHVIFFDYGVSAAIVSNSLSLNAAIFASICLASRLSSADSSFILITVAMQFFVLFPQLRNKLNTFWSVFLTTMLVFCDVYFLHLISATFTVIFIITLVFIYFVCPVLFVRYQNFKENIYGPWDEAIVEDRDVIDFLSSS